MADIKDHLKGIVRTDRLKGQSRKGFLRLDMNESPLGLPEKFVKGVFSRIGNGLVSVYPEYFSLVEKIAKDNKIRPENICLSNGSDAAIKYLFDAFISAGDKVLIADPSFAMYKVYCGIFNARPVTVPYRDDFSFPQEDFFRMLRRGVKLAVVVNPNNPTGSAVKRDILLKIIRRAEDNGILLIVDEAYYYFYRETMIGDVNKFNNLVVLRTFSKLCGMAGLRIGFAASSTKVISGMKKVRPTYDVNAIAAFFAEEALRRPKLLDSLISQTMEGKAFLVSRLAGSGIEFRDGAANFILIRCPGCAVDTAKRLRSKKVLVGFGFEQPFLKDYIRVTLGDKKTMLSFWNIFERIIKGNAKNCA